MTIQRPVETGSFPVTNLRESMTLKKKKKKKKRKKPEENSFPFLLSDETVLRAQQFRQEPSRTRSPCDGGGTALSGTLAFCPLTLTPPHLICCPSGSERGEPRLPKLESGKQRRLLLHFSC